MNVQAHPQPGGGLRGISPGMVFDHDLVRGGIARKVTQFADPLTVDFERANANDSLTFGAGIHRCLGSHLATTQLRISLQEVHRAIPDYRLDQPVAYESVGPKATPRSMHLAFTPNRFEA